MDPLTPCEPCTCERPTTDEPSCPRERECFENWLMLQDEF
jgi:hypothetical protein